MVCRRAIQSFLSSIFTSSLFIAVTPFLIYSGEYEQWASHPEWLWCDDFEHGQLSIRNYQDIDTTGFNVSTETALNGTHSLRQHYVPNQVDAGWISKVNDKGYPEHLFVRWYHKFEAGFEGLPPKMARVQYRNRTGDWSSIFSIHCWIDDGVVVADILAKNSTQKNSAGWLPITASKFSFQDPAHIGTWICFEMEVQLNTVGKSDGIVRIWADDSIIINKTGLDLRGSEQQLLNEVMLDCYWNTGSPKDQSRYYDNFIISTSKIGMIKETTTIKKQQAAILQCRTGKNMDSRINLDFLRGKSSHIYINLIDKNPPAVYLFDGSILKK